MLEPRKLTKIDYDIPCKQMAIDLLGKLLVRQLQDGTILKARIVETECYLGGEDKASHSYNGRQTPSNKPMYMPAGTSYVYMTYGMYYCFNISSLEPGAAVLLRALEPIENIEVMRQFRSVKRKNNSKPYKDIELCNGPSKLCIAFDITKNNCNMLDLSGNNMLWVEDDGYERDFRVVKTARIGIASAGVEWASKPFRFYILNNPHVSKRDRKAEKDLDLNL